MLFSLTYHMKVQGLLIIFAFSLPKIFLIQSVMIINLKKIYNRLISYQIQIYFFPCDHFTKKYYISCSVKVQYLHQS